MRQASKKAAARSKAASRKGAPGNPKRSKTADEGGEDAGEQPRPDEAGDPLEAAIGALELALLARPHHARHQPLQGRTG